MTEIIIRNGVIANLSFNPVAWDAARFADIATGTNSASRSYSVWSDYTLSTTKKFESTYNDNDTQASTLTLNPPFTSYNIYNDDAIEHPYFTGASAITYAGEDVVFDTTVGVIMMYARQTTPLTTDTSIFILSLGITKGTTAFAGGSRIPYPSMTYASMHYFFDFNNTHHYLVCRVGTKIEKVKLNQFEPNKPHIYAVTQDATNCTFYMNDLVLAVIPNISSSVDAVWNSAYNYRNWDTVWIGGRKGYVENPTTLTTQQFAVFAIVNSVSPISELIDLALNRYTLCTTGHTASSTSITLNSSTIVVFDSATFSGLLVML